MSVLVTGAFGLIGSACLVRLHGDGHDVVGAGRRVAEAARRFPYARWITADFNRLTEVAGWRVLLVGIDAVVNCVGVLQDGARDDMRRVHVAATCALFDACAQAGIRRVVHVSAIGASSEGPTAFARTKAEADTYLQSLDLEWIILRPALVLAPAVHGGTAMLRAIAAFPGAVPVIGAERRIQVVSVDDIADTVARCLAPQAPLKRVFELAHPQVHTVCDVIVAMRQWLGFPPRPLIALPRIVEMIVAAAADALGWLGWRSPARTTAFAQLTAGVVGEPTAWIAATGIRPRSLDDILNERPATVQDRWFVRLYLLKPVALAGLALFWIMTGVITLGPGRAAAATHLIEAGFGTAFAGIAVILGALFDILLGLLLVFRRLAKPTLVVMLAATLCYLLAGTMLAPLLWLDPLGPLLKTIPVLLATAFTLAILDER